MQTINKKAMSKQYMILNVLAFAEENSQAFENDALFQKHLQTLKTNAGAILALEEKILLYRMPLGEQKKTLLAKYMAAVSVLVDALNEVALVSENNDLLQFLSSCKSELRNSSQFVRLGLSRTLFDYVNTFRTDLEALNNGKEIVGNAEESFQAYNDIMLLPAQKRKKAATFFNDYNQLIKVTIEYLRAHVRPYFTRAFVNQPSLLDLFERYLELPNMGKRTSKEEEAEDAMDNSTPDASAAAPDTTEPSSNEAKPSNTEDAAPSSGSTYASNNNSAPTVATNASPSEAS